MKTSFLLLGVLFLQLSLAQAKIQEALTMEEVKPFVNSKTIVVFDLDNTVFESVQTLGSDQFFGKYLLKAAESSNLEGKKALDWALEKATLVQPLSKVQAVEAITPAWIRDLQKKSIVTFGLTSRPKAWKEGTIQQLTSVGVNFSLSAKLSQDRPVGPNKQGELYHGVIFMGDGGAKGDYLLEFLKQNGMTGSRVVFIDDKLGNVQSVETVLNPTEIEHLSVRYGAADEKVKAFNYEVADFEWKYFLKCKIFLSDLDAKQMLAKQREGIPLGCLASVR